MKKAGYWAGGGFILLSAVSLSLGLVPLFQAAFHKPITFRVPGQLTLDLRLTGTYIGAASFQTLTPEQKRNAVNMDYWLSDSSEKEFFTVNKFPSRKYYSEKDDEQVPLFELIIKEKGKYVFTSDYPIGVDGPAIPVVLHRYDAPRVRSVLIVGIVLSLLLAGTGGILIWKARKMI